MPNGDPFSTSNSIKRARAIHDAQEAAEKTAKRESLNRIAANEARAKRDPNDDIGFLRKGEVQRKFKSWKLFKALVWLDDLRAYNFMVFLSCCSWYRHKSIFFLV